MTTTTAEDEDNVEASEVEASEAFPSLGALQLASDQLILSLPDDDAPTPSEAESEDTAERIRYFITQAIATGAALDDAADRRTAQALIDFWGAKSYGVARGSRGRARRSWRPTQVLVPFDPATIETTIERADTMFAGLDAKDQDIARQILLRIVRLGVDGSAGAASVERAELASLGKPERTDKIVEALLAAGVLVPTSENEKQIVSLRNEALIRNWKPLSSWIEERTRFRRETQYWEQNGHPSANLVSGRRADRALVDYADLTTTERAFIAKSSVRSRYRNIFVGVAVTACITACIAAGVFFYNQQKAILQQKEQKAKISFAFLRAADRELQPDLKWLADRNLPIKLQNRDVTNLDFTNFYRSFETPAVVDFVKSNLRSVKFDFSKASVCFI